MYCLRPGRNPLDGVAHPCLVRKTSLANVGKGAAAGALGGFVGGAAMLAYGAAFDHLFDRNTGRRNRPRKFLPTADQELDGTAVIAYAAGRAFGRELKGAGLVNTARTMHFLFAAALGAAYGALAELTPATTLGYGTLFAAAEELSGNEWLMPKIGFLRPLNDYPVHERVHSLTSHLLWGAVTECIRRRMR
jgi:putative membrane protein